MGGREGEQAGTDSTSVENVLKRRRRQGEQTVAAFRVAVAHLDTPVAVAAAVALRLFHGNLGRQILAAPFFAAAAEEVTERNVRPDAAGGTAGRAHADAGAGGAAAAGLAGDDLAVAGRGFAALGIDQHQRQDLAPRRNVVDPELQRLGLGARAGTHQRRVGRACAGAEDRQYTDGL